MLFIISKHDLKVENVTVVIGKVYTHANYINKIIYCRNLRLSFIFF
jgi:hypothetical protein